MNEALGIIPALIPPRVYFKILSSSTEPGIICKLQMVRFQHFHPAPELYFVFKPQKLPHRSLVMFHLNPWAPWCHLFHGAQSVFHGSTWGHGPYGPKGAHVGSWLPESGVHKYGVKQAMSPYRDQFYNIGKIVF